MGRFSDGYPCHTCESVPAQVVTCLVEFAGACFFFTSAACFTGRWKIMALLRPFSSCNGVAYLVACVFNIISALLDAYGNSHQMTRIFDIMATWVVTAAAMVFNSTLLVLLVQDSVGWAAVSRAVVHGSVHTGSWIVLFLSLEQVEDYNDNVSRAGIFGFAVGANLGWWAMYFGGLELLIRWLPDDCCCIKGAQHHALRSPAVLLALAQSLFWEIASFAIYLWGHNKHHHPNLTHHHAWEWASITSLCYIIVFPILFYIAALQQTRYWQGSHEPKIEGSEGILDWQDYEPIEKIGSGGGATIYRGKKLSDSSEVCLRFIHMQCLTYEGDSQEEQLRKQEIVVTIVAQQCEVEDCNPGHRVVKFIGYYINPPDYVIVYKLYTCSLTQYLGIGGASAPSLHAIPDDVKRRLAQSCVTRSQTPAESRVTDSGVAAPRPVSKRMSASFSDHLVPGTKPRKTERLNTSFTRNKSWTFARAKEPRRPLKERLEIAVEVAKAVQHLHHLSRPIIHRDIKPSNFLCERDDEGTRIVVADFGEALFYKPDEDGTDLLIASSILYQPPELLKAKGVFKYEPSSDIYALACTLWQILTGKELYAEYDLSSNTFALQDEIKFHNRRPDTRAFWTAQEKLEDDFLLLISDAWDQEPRRRPSAQVIVNRLFEMLHESCEKYIEVEANPIADKMPIAGALSEDDDASSSEKLQGAITII